MTDFDYNKTYYVVINNEENHNFKYKNEFSINFNTNPQKACVDRGLYFTDYKNIYQLVNNATYLQEVKIPEDANVKEITNEGKWHTNKLILRKRYHLWDNFDKWFNPEEWNWEKGSWILAHYFSQQFDEWWNPEKWNWEKSSHHLAMFCLDYFDKWWDPEKWNWEKYSYHLAKYCSNYFDKWWNPKKFNWEEGLDALEEFCSQYKHIWGKERNKLVE